MRREWRERFPHHQLQTKPLVSDPVKPHGTCRDSCRDRLTRGGVENVPGIPGACATHKFTYLARGPLASYSGILHLSRFVCIGCYCIAIGGNISSDKSVWFQCCVCSMWNNVNHSVYSIVCLKSLQWRTADVYRYFMFNLETANLKQLSSVWVTQFKPASLNSTHC